MNTSRAQQPKRKSQRAPWGWAIGGAIVGLLAAVLVFAPARWLQLAVNRASNGRLVLGDAQGSVWNGSAQLSLSGGEGSRDQVRLPGRVQWTVVPGAGVLQLSVDADCCLVQPQTAIFQPGWGGWRLQLFPSESTWPAGLLTGLGTPWNTVQLQGRLLLSTPGLQLTSAYQRLLLEGGMTLQLIEASSRLSTVRPLGSYRLDLVGGEAPRMVLRTTEGQLHLQGLGQWAGGRLRFEGEASADAEHQSEFSNLLNIIGRRDGLRSVITLG